MRTKLIAVVLILGVSAAAFVALRKENRADAAASDCYSSSQGPSTPTICN